MANGCHGPGGKRGWQGRGEDETAGKGADEITKCGRAGDITAHDAECFAQRALDQGHAIHHAIALGNTTATWPIHANRVDLIEVSHRTKLIRQITDLGNRRDVSVHGVNTFKRNDLGRIRRAGLKLAAQIGHIIVLPDLLVAARVANAFDHGRMIERIRQDHRIWQACAQR